MVKCTERSNRCGRLPVLFLLVGAVISTTAISAPKVPRTMGNSAAKRGTKRPDPSPAEKQTSRYVPNCLSNEGPENSRTPRDGSFVTSRGSSDHAGCGRETKSLHLEAPISRRFFSCVLSRVLTPAEKDYVLNLPGRHYWPSHIL